MSRPQAPQKAKLVISILLHNPLLFEQIMDKLEAAYGPTDIFSPWLAFDFTNYYAAEMGSPLQRRVVVFERLIDQDALAEIKLATNAIETQFEHDGRRQCNLDPGYLLYERFVLATGKNFTHRIYIGKGIYADLTLIFQKGAYRPLPWTYPDYACDDMRAFLATVRKTYARNLAALTAVRSVRLGGHNDTEML